MENNLGNVISSDYVRNYTFDGNGNNFNNTNNATVTNPVYSNSSIGYQRQSLVWGATTTCTYASVTYTNSYIWIYASGSWTFTKNSAKVTAVALIGVNGERYAMLKFFNRTLTDSEEQILKLEGLKKLGPSELPNYGNLLSDLVYYSDFKGTAHNLVDGSLGTVTGATLVADRFNNSNSAYNFGTSGNSNYIRSTNILGINGGVVTFGAWVKKNVNLTSGKYSQAIYQKNNTSKIEYRLGIDNNNGTEKIGFTRGKIGVADNDCNIISLQDTTLFHHWCGTYDGTNLRFYLDGVLQKTLASSGNGTVTVYTDGFSIGNNNDSSAFIQNALTVDMGFIFNRALSSSEVSQLYQLTLRDYIYPNKSYDLLSLRQGLVLDLNEQGKDLSGLNNHGALVNAPVVVRQGKAKGLSYNGTTQYTTFTNSVISGSKTVSFWLKSSSKTHQTFILNNSWDLNTNGFACYSNITTGLLTFQFRQGGGIAFLIKTTFDVCDGKIRHITLTWDGTTNTNKAIIYINGIVNSTGTSTLIESSSPTYNLKIGTTNLLLYKFNGSMISPKIWNRALSDKEIQALYYSQAASFNY